MLFYKDTGIELVKKLPVTKVFVAVAMIEKKFLNLWEVLLMPLRVSFLSLTVYQLGCSTWCRAVESMAVVKIILLG